MTTRSGHAARRRLATCVAVLVIGATLACHGPPVAPPPQEPELLKTARAEPPVPVVPMPAPASGRDLGCPIEFKNHHDASAPHGGALRRLT